MIDRAIVGGMALAICLAAVSGVLLTVLDRSSAEFVVTAMGLFASLLCVVLALVARALRKRSRDRGEGS